MTTGSGSFLFLGRDADTPPTPIRQLYAVFRRSARPRDVYAQLLARREQYGGLEDLPDTLADMALVFREQIGTAHYKGTRLIVGTARRGVYAVPTTAEAICLGSFPNGGGNSGRPGPHGLRISYADGSRDSPLLLYGIVGDDVAGVEVVTGAKTREAELGENGYWLELPPGVGEEQLRELILHLHDGATDAFPLHIPPGPARGSA